MPQVSAAAVEVIRFHSPTSLTAHGSGAMNDAAAAAAGHDVPVVAVCGRRTVGDAELRAAGIEAAYAISSPTSGAASPRPVRYSNG